MYPHSNRYIGDWKKTTTGRIDRKVRGRARAVRVEVGTWKNGATPSPPPKKLDPEGLADLSK